MTRRLVRFATGRALEAGFAVAAKETGLSERSLRYLFDARVEELETRVPLEAPRRLGIDEVHVHRKAFAVFVDLDRNRVIEIARSRSKASVARVLASMSNNARIEHVAMDMARPYCEAVEAVLPSAIVVIDKRHVLETVRRDLEALRRRLKKSMTAEERKVLKHETWLFSRRRFELDMDQQLRLSHWLRNGSALGRAWKIKERFYDIMSMASRAKAEPALDGWIASIDRDLEGVFFESLRALKNWREPILAYFDSADKTGRRVTNAATEGMNRLIKEIHHGGRGYAFERLRARVLTRHGRWQAEYVAIAEGRRAVHSMAHNMAHNMGGIGSKGAPVMQEKVAGVLEVRFGISDLVWPEDGELVEALEVEMREERERKGQAISSHRQGDTETFVPSLDNWLEGLPLFEAVS